ncbi:Early nodulin-like protein 1 [Hordeum vulgare]|nr:Early nodulin-like protein 1 [Hordeum vulgare]
MHHILDASPNSPPPINLLPLACQSRLLLCVSSQEVASPAVWPAMASLLSLVLLLALLDTSRATNFEVGGDAEWVLPQAGDSNTYNHWASKKHFHVGDIVHFKYNQDSVMVVTEAGYNKCESSHPIFFSNNGNTEVRLDRPGPFYFISGVAGHCQVGQKLVIHVAGKDTPPSGPPSGAAPAGFGTAGAIVVFMAVILHVLVMRGI